MERGSVEKLKTIRDDVLHENSTNMSEAAFKKFIDAICDAFRGLKWNTGDLQQLIETQQCISFQEYQRLKQIYEHEKEQFLLESRQMDQRASGLEKTIQRIEGEVLQLKHKFEERESREVTEKGNVTKPDERVSSLERSLHEMQEIVMQLKLKNRQARDIHEMGIFIEKENDMQISDKPKWCNKYSKNNRHLSLKC